MNRPKQKDFIERDRFGDGHVNSLRFNSLRYAEALEKYCDYLETIVNVLKDMLNYLKETK